MSVGSQLSAVPSSHSVDPGCRVFSETDRRPRKVTFITPDAQRDASTRPRGSPGGTPARVPDDVPHAGWTDDARARDASCHDDWLPARRTAAASDARPGVGRASTDLGERARPAVGRATSSAPAALPALFWSATLSAAAVGRAPAAPAPVGASASPARIAGAGPADTEFLRGRRGDGARAWNARGFERRHETSGDDFWCSSEHIRDLRPRPRRRPRVVVGGGRERNPKSEIRQGQERLAIEKPPGQRRDLPDGG